MSASETLPRGVRFGYGSGSVATGAFGTVPGLMLLPYLTDSLGIAALWAGVIVFAPKAWDVILNPVAGRVSDRTVDPTGPLGAGQPWALTLTAAPTAKSLLDCATAGDRPAGSRAAITSRQRAPPLTR